MFPGPASPFSGRYEHLHQPLPFPGFINGMHQRQFVFAVQRFRDLRRQRSQGTVAVGGESAGWSQIMGYHLQKGKKKASRDATQG